MQGNAGQAATKPLMDRATSLHRAGALADAERLYRQVLEVEPGHAAALGLLGLIQHDCGRTEAGIELLQRSIQADPQSASMHLNLGTVFAECGRLSEAINHYQHVVRLTPSDMGAVENLLKALRDAGRVQETVPLLRQQLAQQPQATQLRYRLALTLIELQEFEGAQVEFQHPALQAATFPGMSYQQALVMFKLQKFRESIPLLQVASKENPRSFEVHFLLGTVQLQLENPAEALIALQQACILNPKSAEAQFLLATAQMQTKRYAGARTALHEVLRLAPGHAAAQEMLVDLALTTWELGDDALARESLVTRLGASQDAHLRVARDLMIPQIMGTRDEVLESRERFARNLDALLESPPSLTLPSVLIGTSNFYLAYHGLGDKSLLEKYSQFCLRACPSLEFTADHCHSNRRKPGRKRVGFFSKYIMKHSVSLCFSKIVEAMSATNEFDVYLISQFPFDDQSVSQAYPNFQGTKVQLPPSGLSRWRETIASLELDILVYLDVGMDVDGYFLALARLAHVQCVMGGHPDTTGIRNMDYFISSELAEVEEADAHYSEKLLRLPISTFYFRRPQLPQSAFGHKKGRAEFGLPPTGRLYLCPSVQQKLHPDFDDAIARILELDPQGHVVLFRDPQYTAWTGRTERRLDRTIPAELRQRVLMIPWVHSPVDFANVNALADVILDPFHFGLGSTGMTTYTVAVPTITKPSGFLRGRTGLFFSRLLDLPECITGSTEEFAQRAVAVASNRDLREELGRRILRNNSVLYDNPQPIRDMVEALQRI